MNTAKKDLSERKKMLLEKKRLSKIITDWAGKNKKVFWKYEVSSFHKTYLIKVTNMPEPSVNDIQLSSNKKLLSDLQKKQLCDAIINNSPETKAFNDLSFDVQIDFVDGAVIAEVI
jgi:hypothetical protein